MALIRLVVLFLIGALLGAQAPSPFSSGFSTGFGPSPRTPSGQTLSSGYFTVSGNQFLDGSGNPQRLACTQFLGSPNDGTMAAIRAQGQFNCVVIDWRDQLLTTLSPPATGCNTFAQIDTCVANAAANNLKVILSHRGNEIPISPSSSCWSRQANGLPYDSGSLCLARLTKRPPYLTASHSRRAAGSWISLASPPHPLAEAPARQQIRSHILLTCIRRTLPASHRTLALQPLQPGTHSLASS
jgi:hypothetical protein